MSKRRAGTRRDKDRRPGRRPRVVSASEAAKNFGALVNRVREEHATYVVERAGAPVVRISPLERGAGATLGDLVDLLRGADHLGEAYLREVEAGIRSLNKPASLKTPWES